MKIGFSTLSLFMKSFEEWLETASSDGFNMMEILCEGPNTWPRIALSFGKEPFQIFESYDIGYYPPCTHHRPEPSQSQPRNQGRNTDPDKRNH